MPNQSCTCAGCQSLCKVFPGSMSPGEVRRLAAHLNVEVISLFSTHLGFDRWLGGFGDVGEQWEDVYTVVPATTHFGPGDVYSRPPFDWTPKPCALQDASGLCTIHAAKPRECRWAFSNDHGEEATGNMRRIIARAWARPAAARYMAWIRAELRAKFGNREDPD